MENVIKIVNELKRPVSAREVTKRMHLAPSQMGMVKTLLDRLVKEGRLRKKEGRYAPVSERDLIEGKVCATLSGADFFVSEHISGDLKIVSSKDKCVMHNDRVLVKKTGNSCRIVQILQRANETLVGTLYRDGTTTYLVSDEKKIHELFIIPKGKANGAKAADKVVCRILSYPTGKANGLAEVSECLGSSEDDSTAILSALYRYGVRDEFDKRALDEADNVEQSVGEDELCGRLDLRELTVITIDGDDAKDLDDAVSLEITDKGEYLLGVHIADVSHYVNMDSAIDVEARTRATSVYIPGKVFPMLPRALSNGICSLNEGVDRLCLSCFMIINKKGEITEYAIEPSVIRSKHRMTYSVVTDMLENTSSPYRKEYKDILGMLILMHRLALILNKWSYSGGCIDFDLPEAKIVLDESDFPVEIKEYETGISNKIIEEFMLAANRTVAGYMLKKEIPAIYRVHEAPDSKKIEGFSALASALGYFVPEEPSPKDMQRVLEGAKGKAEEALIKKTMLRSMSKAKYKATCDGHYGLAFDKYLHFTSPIRRYPDLIVHRAIKMHLAGNRKGLNEIASRLENMANVSTEQEINAASCERDVEDIRKAQYMSKHLGEEYEGCVSGVMGYGMYVELDNTCEGFIPINTMDGYFVFEESRFALESVDKSYRLGDRVKVRVFDVNIPDGKVEFTLLA